MPFISIADDQEVHHLGHYFPYKGGSNPKFDSFSGKILDLKQSKPGAINYFYEEINELLKEGIVIATVPSSDPAKTESGIVLLGRKLAGNNRYDGTSCLVRHTQIKKLADGGHRGPEVHLNSIRVENIELIRNRTVLLLDDISSTHNSLITCKGLLLEAGAEKVTCYAVGQTNWS